MARAREGDWSFIGASTTGIVFMGTPHYGTDAYQAIMYGVIAAGLEVQDGLLRAMSAEDNGLIDTREEFIRLVNDPSARIQICCFFEQKSTAIGRIIGDASIKVKVKLSFKMLMLTASRSL
jgi:hypothetical protein